MEKLATFRKQVKVTEVIFTFIMLGAGSLSFVGIIGTHLIEVFVMLDITNHTFHRVLVRPVVDDKARK